MSSSSLMIEIDCPPGATRPGHYFANIFQSLTTSDNEKISEYANQNKNKSPISTKFGNWEWILEFTEDQIEIKTIIKNHFIKELTSLYNVGAIRYASWN